MIPPVPVPVVSLSGISKTYGSGETAVHALKNVGLTIERGDYVAIMGASGSGKSTLMHIVGCLDVPTSGRYLLGGVDVGALGEAGLAIVRNRKIGFVFQAFNLLARTTAHANVELPLAYAGVKPAECRSRAAAALAVVGLTHRMDRLPSELSGGQQQRVAVARALVTAPAMVLADEPTGNLDSLSAADVLHAVDALNHLGHTVVLVTHEDDVADHAKRTVRLKDGEIVEDRRTADLDAPPPLYSPTEAAS